MSATLFSSQEKRLKRIPYRRQGRQNVDLPDPTALQVCHRGLLLGPVLWRHLCKRRNANYPTLCCTRKSVDGREKSSRCQQKPTGVAQQTNGKRMQPAPRLKLKTGRTSRVALTLTSPRLVVCATDHILVAPDGWWHCDVLLYYWRSLACGSEAAVTGGGGDGCGGVVCVVGVDAATMLRPLWRR